MIQACRCRREFVTCEERLLRDGRKQEASLFNLVKPDVSLHDTCNYRYTPSTAACGGTQRGCPLTGPPCVNCRSCGAVNHTCPSRGSPRAPVSRFPMYIESDAWVTNLKQKLACGSILVSNKMEYYEFFTRALQPGLHYVQVDPGDLCNDTAFKVQPSCRADTLPALPV